RRDALFEIVRTSIPEIFPFLFSASESSLLLVLNQVKSCSGFQQGSLGSLAVQSGGSPPFPVSCAAELIVGYLNDFTLGVRSPPWRLKQQIYGQRHSVWGSC